jgi:hypothetical protein
VVSNGIPATNRNGYTFILTSHSVANTPQQQVRLFFWCLANAKITWQDIAVLVACRGDALKLTRMTKTR